MGYIKGIIYGIYIIGVIEHYRTIIQSETTKDSIEAIKNTNNVDIPNWLANASFFVVSLFWPIFFIMKLFKNK